MYQVKTILQGTLKWGRRQGRLEFAKKSQRPVENREKWRKLVVKLSVVAFKG